MKGNWIDVKDRLPQASKDGSVTVEVVIENMGGGITTYEETFDSLMELEDGSLEWLDGDGKFGRTTIYWKED